MPCLKHCVSKEIDRMMVFHPVVAVLGAASNLEAICNSNAHRSGSWAC
jgi:hypothetical protein